MYATAMPLNQSETASVESDGRLEALKEHVSRLDMTAEGKEYVISVASSPPSRTVGTARIRNLNCEVPIQHLGVTLQTESGSGEYFFLLEMLRCKDVLAIFEQPQPVSLRITTKAGVVTPITYTPDFLVVFVDRVEIYEVRRDDKLESDCRNRPSDWVCRDGQFHYLPAEKYFRNFGIQHITSPNSNISSVRADNLRLLLAVRRVEETQRLQELRARAKTILDDVDVIKMGDVLSLLNTADATVLLQLLDQGLFFADLDKCLLSSPERVWISSDPALAKIASATKSRLESLIRENQFVSTLAVPDPRHLGEVAVRFATCGLCEPLEINSTRKSLRTKRRYVKQLRDAGGDPRVLLPKWGRCGNREKRISDEHQTLIRKVVLLAKRDPNSPSIAGAFRAYTAEFDRCGRSKNEVVVAVPTFYRYFKSLPDDADAALSRGGRRLQNASADAIDPSQRTLIPTRAFAISHVDHYNVDLAVVVGSHKGTKVTKRAWLTAMVDAYSGEVLGLWLSFRSPCRQSAAMVVRDCARRHGRLPEIIVVDGGKDFQSVHFTTMLATLGVTRVDRPPEDPRFGKEVERLFGSFKERFFRGLPGFVPGLQHARKTSGSHSASKRAKLTLPDLIDALEAYAFGGYNHEQKPNGIDSRLAMRAKSDDMFPFSGLHIVFDTAFLIQTAVEAPAETYQLSPGRGVRVYGVWYSSRGILDYRGPKKGVAIRIEPFDKSVVYVCINREWHVARSSDAIACASLPESEVLAETAYHQQLRGLAKQLATESERAAYEQKRMALPTFIDGPSEQAKSHRQKSSVQYPSPKVKTPFMAEMDEISDLEMDEESS